jgi:hypothetical protein
MGVLVSFGCMAVVASIALVAYRRGDMRLSMVPKIDDLELYDVEGTPTAVSL